MFAVLRTVDARSAATHTTETEREPDTTQLRKRRVNLARFLRRCESMADLPNQDPFLLAKYVWSLGKLLHEAGPDLPSSQRERCARKLMFLEDVVRKQQQELELDVPVDEGSSGELFGVSEAALPGQGALATSQEQPWTTEERRLMDKLTTRSKNQQDRARKAALLETPKSDELGLDGEASSNALDAAAEAEGAGGGTLPLLAPREIKWAAPATRRAQLIDTRLQEEEDAVRLEEDLLKATQQLRISAEAIKQGLQRGDGILTELDDKIDHERARTQNERERLNQLSQGGMCSCLWNWLLIIFVLSSFFSTILFMRWFKKPVYLPQAAVVDLASVHAADLGHSEL